MSRIHAEHGGGHAPEPVPVYLNMEAGPRRTSPATVAKALGVNRVRVRAVAQEKIETCLRDQVAAGADIVGVAGGDGTLHTAARILAGTQSALLPVPTGTLNAFARRVGITSVADAAAALRARRIASISVGTAQGEPFLNTLTLGEYARVVRQRENRPRFVGRWPAALIAITRTLLTVETVVVELEVDGETMTRETPFLWIGVGRGSFPKVWDSPPPTGRPELEVVVLRPVGRFEGARFLGRLAARLAFSRGPVRDPALDVLHARELRVASPHDIDATTDGELRRLRSPVGIGLRHDTLRVITGSSDAGRGLPDAGWH